MGYFRCDRHDLPLFDEKFTVKYMRKRERTEGGMSDAELSTLGRTFRFGDGKLENSVENTTVFRALLHFCKCRETWAEFSGRTGISKYSAKKWLDAFLSVNDFDQTIRWREAERVHEYDGYTCIVDVTTTALDLHPSNDPDSSAYPFTSGHKGVCYKYQVCTTLQGTPIHVTAALPGRRNDVYLFTVPLDVHYDNDYCLLDGGYPGLNNHCRIPIRKPVRREFTADQLSSNRVLSRRRSNIERTNALIKRFALLHATVLDPRTHSKFVKLVLLCQHVLDRERNLVSPRYEKSRIPLAPGALCDCDWKKDACGP